MTDPEKITKRGFNASYTAESYATAAPAVNLWGAMLLTMKYGREGVRKSHYDEEPVDPERVEALEEYRVRYDALIAEGDAQGFIEDDYEGGNYCVSEIRPKYTTVYDETEEEYQARLIQLEKRGKIPPAFGGSDE